MSNKSNKIKIEYCTGWGYLARAVALTRNILKEHANNITELILEPSSDGVLEVSVNDELIFSKKELDRYPEKKEIEELVTEKIS